MIFMIGVHAMAFFSIKKVLQFALEIVCWDQGILSDHDKE
jgi:hypothetical protein